VIPLTPIRRRWLTVALLLGTGLHAQVGGVLQQEDDLRAALVLGFARFTEWPAGQREGPLVIGVLGHGGIVASMEKVAAGKSVNGRPVTVRPLRTAAQAAGCHIVYFGRLQGLKLADALKEMLASESRPARLLIGEEDRFLSAGGAVHLFEEDGRMSFDANLDALQHANLTISSKLLRLGYTTRDNKRGRTKP
jgi:hypothetical protein